MIRKLVTFALVSAFAYGVDLPTASAVAQLPTAELPSKLNHQVGPYLYKVRDDHPASSKEADAVQIAKANGEKESLQQQLLTKEKEIAILRGKTAAATDLLTFEKNRANALETQLAQHQLELKMLRGRGPVHDQLSHELVITKSSLDQARQKVVDLERQLATSNLEHAKRRIAELDRQVEVKDKEIVAMRTSGEDKEKLKSDLASRTEELKQAKQHIVVLEQDFTLAKETLDKVSRRLTDLDSQLTTRNAQLDQAKQLLASLQQNEAKKQEDLLSQKPTIADTKEPRPASTESGQLTANREQPSLPHSDESESSGGDLAKLNRDLSTELQPELTGGGVLLRQAGNKLSLELATGELFTPGQTAMTQHGNSLLQRIGAVLQKFRYQTIQVAGHTDNTPVRGGVQKTFRDNSGLSWARAQQASQALISGGLQADRVKAVGYAATKPIATNATEEGRDKNRRIGIIITQWSEPDDSSSDTPMRVSKKRPMFSTQKVAHR